MNYSEILPLFQESATIKLFRSDHAPLILAFFMQLAREKNLLVLSEAELIELLADFLEDVGFLDTQDTPGSELGQLSYFEQRAAVLIQRWCDQGYLRNYLSPKGDTLYELTPESEKALQWLESLKKQEFVGTESRIKDIVSKMQSLVENANTNPDMRLQDLELRKLKIEQEIQRIQRDQTVQIFDDYQVKSRFMEINRLAQQLLSDFREVEDNFRDITREIYQRHMELRGGKGKILRYAFDAIESLKSSDQGKSFYAFWDYLLVTSGQQELIELTEKVYSMLSERGIDQADSFLRHLRTYLHQAAQKVLDSNDRMAERLSRIIIDKDPQESRKMKETVARIKELAVRLADQDYGSEGYLKLELKPSISMPMERRLSLRPEDPIFLEQPEADYDYEEPPEALDYLFNAFFVDKDAIRERVAELLTEYPEMSLKRLLQAFPIQQGLPELFTYLSLATQQQELVQDQSEVVIPFDFENNRALVMPDVRFKRL